MPRSTLPIPRSAPAFSCRVRVAFLATSWLALLGSSESAVAQMPGLPVLQNAFANPGFTVAANVGYASSALGYAAAAAWAPASARFVVSAGVGGLSPEEGESIFTAGARIAAPVRSFFEEALGVSAFAGVGSGWRDGSSQFDVPAGAGVGWRRAYGTGSGISVYAAPMIRWMRNAVDDQSSSALMFRGSVGIDVTITPAIGATLGFEFGQTEAEAAPTLARNVLGAGVSYVFR